MTTKEQEKIILTYDEVHKMSLDLAEKVRPHKPDLIIGLSRGGLLPAIIISHALNVPMVPVSYSSKAGRSDDQSHMNVLKGLPCSYLPIIKEKTICVVDDILDSGHTMREVTAHFMNLELNNNVFSVSLVAKGVYEHNSHISTMWLSIHSPWVIFPFENQ